MNVILRWLATTDRRQPCGRGAGCRQIRSDPASRRREPSRRPSDNRQRTRSRARRPSGRLCRLAWCRGTSTSRLAPPAKCMREQLIAFHGKFILTKNQFNGFKFKVTIQKKITRVIAGNSWNPVGVHSTLTLLGPELWQNIATETYCLNIVLFTVPWK